MDWPSIKMDSTGTWPPLNPNWFKQQELMSQVGPFIAGMGFGGGAAPAQGGAKAQETQAEAPKEEVKKTHYDIELVSFDAAQKIKLIKEVRQIFNLGLKEAKEMVETAPQWIKKECKADDAEDLKSKLEAQGAVIRLV